MGVVFVSTEVQGEVAQLGKMYVGLMLIVDNVFATNVKIHKSRNGQSQVVHVDKLKVCRWETPSSWLFIDDGAEDVVAASEDEGVDELTPGDGTGNGLPGPMDGKQYDERPTGSTSGQLDDASTGNENEDGVSSSRPTRQRQPPAYLRDYLRTVRETARYSPTEIGCVGWFDTQAGQSWPTCLLPLPADVNEEIRIQLAQRYELHDRWMNAKKNHVFMPLARLLYPPDAFEKRIIDLRCRYVAVYASEEKTTAKSGATSPTKAVAARHGESPPADCRVTGANT